MDSDVVAAFDGMLARRCGRGRRGGGRAAGICSALIPPLACSEALCSPCACWRECMSCAGQHEQGAAEMHPCNLQLVLSSSGRALQQLIDIDANASSCYSRTQSLRQSRVWVVLVSVYASSVLVLVVCWAGDASERRPESWRRGQVVVLIAKAEALQRRRRPALVRTPRKYRARETLQLPQR